MKDLLLTGETIDGETQEQVFHVSIKSVTARKFQHYIEHPWSQRRSDI